MKIGNYLIVLALVLVLALEATIIAVAIYRGAPILTTWQFALVCRLSR